MNPERKRTKKRKCVYALLVLIALVFLFRNSIARYTAMEVGSRFLSGPLDIANIRIGLSSIQINGIRVYEPGSTDAQVEVTQIAIAPAPWQGIRTGVWASRIVIREPTLHLRFRGDGSLITELPAGGKSEAGTPQIPVGSLSVRDATLVVHQTGKDTFSIKHAKLIATFADEIRLWGEVPELLGGVVQLQAIVNAETLAGQSKLTVDNVLIDTAVLSNLPLVPASINQEPVNATVSLTLSGDHPASEFDLRRHGFDFVANIRDVHSQRLGKLCNDFSIHTTQMEGKLVTRGGGDLSSGAVRISAACDWSVKPLAATASLTADRLDLGQLNSRMGSGLDLGTKLKVQARAKVAAEHGTASFASSVRFWATEIEAEKIQVSEIVGNITSEGKVAWNDFKTLTGNVNGSVRSDGVRVGEVAKRFSLPVSQGIIALDSDFLVSLTDISSPDAVSLNASITASSVAVGDLKLQDTAARLTIHEGVAIVDWKDVAVFDAESSQVASFNASARVPLAPTEQLSTAVHLSLTPTSSLARMLSVDANECGGVLNVDASASCVLSEVARPESWSAMASLQSRELSFAAEQVGDLDARLELSEGRLCLQPFQIQWRENALTVAAAGTVKESLKLSGNVIGKGLNIADVAELASRFSKTPLPASGIAELKGGFEVTTKPFHFVASGSSNVRKALYAGSPIGEANLQWDADLDGLQISSSSQEFLGGTFNVVVHARDLDWTKTVLEGRFQNVQAANLAALVDKQLPISGAFDGGLSLTSIASVETLAGRAWISSRGVSVYRIPVEITSAALTVQSSEIVATCDGAIADGRYQGTARGSLTSLVAFAKSPDRNLSQVPVIVSGKLDNLPIESLCRHLRLPAELRTLGGKLNATVVREPAMLDGRSLFKATGSLSDLRLARVRLSDRITSDITVFGDRVELRRLDGRFADGRLAGKAEVRIAANPTGTFDFSATRVNLRRASAPFVSQPIAGTGTVQLRGRIGQVISGRADVLLTHGLFAGVSVPDAKFPIDWSYSQPSKVARWQCRAGMVSAGGGTVSVSSEGSYGTSLNMTTSARIERVNSSKLIQGKSVGAGIVSGEVNLQAKRARSAKQISGNYSLTLANVQTLAIPVLDQLPRLVSLSPSRPGQGEDGGTVYGRLAGGLVYVDQLAIAQSNVQILMSGNATLDGRLNFDLTASTEANGPADQLLELADSPLMLAAPAPIALVAKANDLLKDRVVHVHVGGNAARPSLRLQPGKQLTQDAVQFFLKTSLGDASSVIVTQGSQQTRR